MKNCIEPKCVKKKWKKISKIAKNNKKWNLTKFTKKMMVNVTKLTEKT